MTLLTTIIVFRKDNINSNCDPYQSYYEDELSES